MLVQFVFAVTVAIGDFNGGKFVSYIVTVCVHKTTRTRGSFGHSDLISHAVGPPQPPKQLGGFS